MKQNKSPFKWRHFEPTIILLCVRWYCRYQLSYRDIEEMMRERGLTPERTLERVEALHMMRKGQVKRLDGRDSLGQAKFIASLFGVVAELDLTKVHGANRSVHDGDFVLLAYTVIPDR